MPGPELEILLLMQALAPAQAHLWVQCFAS